MLYRSHLDGYSIVTTSYKPSVNPLAVYPPNPTLPATLDPIKKLKPTVDIPRCFPDVEDQHVDILKVLCTYFLRLFEVANHSRGWEA